MGLAPFLQTEECMHDWTKDWYTILYIVRRWGKWLLLLSLVVFFLLHIECGSPGKPR